MGYDFEHQSRTLRRMNGFWWSLRSKVWSAVGYGGVIKRSYVGVKRFIWWAPLALAKGYSCDERQIYLALAKGDGNEGWGGRVKELMKGDREHVKRKKKVKEASKESINQTIGAGVGERLFWFRKSANFGCSLIINRRQRNRNPKKKIGIEKDGDESNHRRASENMRARQLPEVSITRISDHPSFTLSFNAV